MKDRMRFKTIALLLSVFVIFSLCSTVLKSQEKKEEKKEEKPKFAYIGAGKCKMCHKGQFASWGKTKHSKAFETLKTDEAKKLSENPTTDPKCLACHTTGYGEKGGYAVPKEKDEESVKSAAIMEGVQCEICHGPGEKYKDFKVMKDKKLAMENGLIEPNEETCKKCHNKNSPTFDEKKWKFEEMFEQVKHPKEKKEEK